VLPKKSSRRKSEARVSFPVLIRGQCRHRDPTKASHALNTSCYIGSSPEIQPTINTHRPRPG
jgi:hypothetical protein